jgi:hypothetical protein
VIPLLKVIVAFGIVVLMLLLGAGGGCAVGLMLGVQNSSSPSAEALLSGVIGGALVGLVMGAVFVALLFRFWRT